MINWPESVTRWDHPSDLDRVGSHRVSTDWVAGLWKDEDAKLLKIDREGRFTTNDEGDLLRMTRPFVEFDSQRHFLLGLVGEAPVFVVEALTEGPVHSLRDIGFRLGDLERDIASAATAVTNWHRAEPRCAQCGNPTMVINGGFARECRTDATQIFPRSDPAVIVAIVDDQDRLLLAGQTTWPERRVSVLAGFVEAGESMEQAVHREILEEVDIHLSDVRYFSSQPWPFPRSLMIGFAARAKTTDISVDGEEIGYADWYSRDRVRSEVESGELILPNQSSIASRLVSAWLQGTLQL